jgi:N,N'-diacetyllegionaminate synthase
MSGAFDIAGRRIGGGAPCWIIAEIGINHGGDEAAAAAMIRAAAAAGADAAKLQTVDADESYVAGTASHREFSGKALSAAAHGRLADVARAAGIVLFTTPADLPSLDLALAAGFPAIKISSGLLTHLPLVRRAAASGQPLIVSTGMAYLGEAAEAVAAARAAGAGGIGVLHCTALYPAPAETLNLAAMATLAECLGCPIGYSDHHPGHLAAVAAVALGAAIVEKHFTLDSKRPGADHAISLEPAAFAAMVRDIRLVETMRGSARKAPAAAEAALRAERHRCLVARRTIAAGERLDLGNVGFKRPLPGRAGLPPAAWPAVEGRRAARAVARDTPIGAADIEPAP